MVLVRAHKDNTLLAVCIAFGWCNVQAKDVDKLSGEMYHGIINISKYESLSENMHEPCNIDLLSTSSTTIA